MKNDLLYRTAAIAGALCLTLSGCAAVPAHGRASQANVVAVDIPVGSDHLPGTLHLAGGQESQPTVIWFQGFPGVREPDPRVIGTLRKAGLNVLTLHYRGSWGVPGTFSLEHALEDARAALAFLREPGTVDAYGIDAAALIPVGDSFGSWVALQTAARDPLVPCAGAALVFNLGGLGSAFAQDEEVRDGFAQMFATVEQDPSLAYRFSAGARGLVEEIIAGRDHYDLSRLVPALRERPLLLIGAANDELAPVAANLEPFASALEAVDNRRVTQEILPGGHDLSNESFAPLLAAWLNRNCR